MRFKTLWSMVGSGPGMAPQYEQFGPVSREMLPEQEAQLIDEILSSKDFKNLQTSSVTSAARDMVFSSLTVEFEDGSKNTVRFMRGEILESLDKIIKLTMRFTLES
ncbi:MAG: hypothetical protein IPL73_03380 [Candidatus Obscuribacter sp.]|jgi:hypothetical protein|nr:hypothetical protein [Candidatus Obscuribacter sp.]MBK9201486.1 hypothetical protein [Candidatus Obscuribacter sp.]MBK9619794.1 hypothetical protein [Candidatus Obscuribacter sp.]